MANEFRVEKSGSGYRVALYRDDTYYVTFVDGLTQAAATRQARSLTVMWRRIQSPPTGDAAVKLKAAS